jgi:3-hydroxyacyl-CoA dehydrogenase/enoyl-CoA hydratase/carnithine racemase
MTMIRIERRDDGVAVVWLDHPDKAVNTLGPALLDEFEDEVLPLLDDPAVRAVVVASAKRDTFIAGADLEILDAMETAEEGSAMSRRGNPMLERVATASKPIVAAVHGAAIGGGLEVALACHYIMASDDPGTVLALPEVQLGLLPGGGGTQRLVERVGLMAALPMLLTGTKVRAKKARRMGLVDAVTTPGGIVDTAARAALDLADGRLARPKRKKRLQDRLAELGPVRSYVLKKARERVQRQTRGNYPAPFAILDCVDAGLAKGRSAGLARESELFGELVVSPESRALVWLFHAMNRAKKPWPQGTPRDVHRLAVLGGGFMGAGVASVSVGSCPVVVRDVSASVLAAAADTLRDGLDKQVRSGSLRRTEADRRMSRLQLTTDVEAIRGADLVIEAVFEDLGLKRRVLAEAEDRVEPTVVLASNTSALPISDIAAEARHPERVLGMHYFSPVPKMPLLEIVVTDRTADWATATAHAVGRAQGKTCIVVADRPGFYTTRILAPYLNEAVLLLEEGARIEAVDTALKNFGFPVGPIALIDEVGIDVGAHVASELGEAFADRGAKTSDAMPRMYEAGYHGRKNRKGFYRYPSGKGRKTPNEEVYALLGGGERRDVATDEMQQRLALLMVNEAVHCLSECVIRSPEHGDLGAVLGLGFPPFRGGPFHYLDAEGASVVVDRLRSLADRHGARFTPAERLVEMAASGGRFYG